MAEKNVVKVVIDGKPIRLVGYESTEYLERVAFYLNNKMAELRELPGFRRQSDETRSILLALNVADDYFKAKQSADSLEHEMETRDGEGYETKQELVAARMRIQELERTLSAYREMHEPVQMELDMPQDAGTAEETAAPAQNMKYAKRSQRYARTQNGR